MIYNKISYSEGDKIGEMTFIKCTKDTRPKWAIFRCKCGKEVHRRVAAVIALRSNTCGCIRLTHGLTINKTRPEEYKIWAGIKARCHGGASKFALKHYKDKGITVCDRWLNSYEAFFEDMGKKPSPKHSIERIDNNGNYEPSNCKWATRTEQARNKSNTVFLEHNGFRYTMAEWAERLGMNYKAFWHLIKSGKTLANIISYQIDIRPDNNNKRYELINRIA